MTLQNVHHIEADIKKKKYLEEPRVTANDDIAFIVSIADNGKTVDMSAVTRTVLASVRPDRQTVITTGTLLTDGTIKYELGHTETKVAGQVKATAQLFDAEGDRISSVAFTYAVEKDPTGEDYIPTEKDKTFIEVVLVDGPAVIQEARDVTATARQSVVDADLATGRANTAASGADTAAGNANSKAGIAQTAADTANTAATSADNAASAANTAAGSANTAASAANTAAVNADEKAALTQQAITDAGTATTAANDAAGRANTAAAGVEDLMGTSNADVFQQISLTQPIDTRSTEIDRASGAVQAIRELDGTAVIRLTELGYGTDGQLAEVVQTAGGKKVTTTLVRDIDGIITGITKGVVDVV